MPVSPQGSTRFFALHSVAAESTTSRDLQHEHNSTSTPNRVTKSWADVAPLARSGGLSPSPGTGRGERREHQCQQRHQLQWASMRNDDMSRWPAASAEVQSAAPPAPPPPFASIGGVSHALAPLLVCLTHHAGATRGFRDVIAQAAAAADESNLRVPRSVGPSGGSAAADGAVTTLHLVLRALCWPCAPQPVCDLLARLGGCEDAHVVFEELIAQLMCELQQLARAERDVHRPLGAVALRDLVAHPPAERAADVPLDFLFRTFVGRVPVHWSCRRCVHSGPAAARFMLVSVSRAQQRDALSAKAKALRMRRGPGDVTRDVTPTLDASDLVAHWMQEAFSAAPFDSGVCGAEGGSVRWCCSAASRYDFQRRGGSGGNEEGGGGDCGGVQWPPVLTIHAQRNIPESGTASDGLAYEPSMPIRYDFDLSLESSILWRAAAAATRGGGSRGEAAVPPPRYELFAAMHHRGPLATGSYSCVVRGNPSTHGAQLERPHGQPLFAGGLGERWFTIDAFRGVREASAHAIVGTVRRPAAGEFVPSAVEAELGPVEMLFYSRCDST